MEQLTRKVTHEETLSLYVRSLEGRVSEFVPDEKLMGTIHELEQ